MKVDWRVAAVLGLVAVTLLLVFRTPGNLRGDALLAANAVLIPVELVIGIRSRGRVLKQSQGALVIASGVAPVLGLAHLLFGGPGLLPASPLLVGVLLVVLAVGATLRVLSLLALGSWYAASVVIQPDQRLVCTGPYALMRHPAYVGYFLVVNGATLLSGSLPALALALVLSIAFVRSRVREEEAALTLAFGDEWRRYAAATPRYVIGPGMRACWREALRPDARGGARDEKT